MLYTPPRAQLQSIRYICGGLTEHVRTSKQPCVRRWSNLIKVNMETGDTDTWFAPHVWPSEPAFIPRPISAGGTGEEDDGVLLSLMMDGEASNSFLLFLDARTFEEIARATIPVVMPYTSHGKCWNAEPVPAKSTVFGQALCAAGCVLPQRYDRIHTAPTPRRCRSNV